MTIVLTPGWLLLNVSLVLASSVTSVILQCAHSFFKSLKKKVVSTHNDSMEVPWMPLL